MMENSKEIVFFHTGYAFVIPLFIFYMSSNPFCTAIAGVMQIFIFHTKYKLLLAENIMELGPDIFAEKFVTALTFPFILLIMFFTITLHHLKQSTVNHARAKRIAEEAVENHKTFIFSFSHELRNPLNSLLGNLQLVLMNDIPSNSKDMVRTAQICGELLLQHINNVLDTGKYEIGKLEINAAATNTYQLFQRVWTFSQELIKRKGLFGHLKIERKVPQIVIADSQKITQVLLNLIGNAVKFTEAGSIQVTVEWLNDSKVNEMCFQPVPYNDIEEGVFEKEENLYMLSLNRNLSQSSQHLVLYNSRYSFNIDETISLQRDVKGILKIIVKDTGCGMKKEALDLLFQKFSQVSQDISKRQTGTGLGLFITQEICKKMSGEVRVYSKENVGSTFVVCLPITSAPNQREEKVSTLQVQSILRQKKVKAIIADDSPFNVSLIRGFFERIGVEIVKTAVDGSDAVEKYIECVNAGKTVDIVTLDIDMPKMNGLEACQRIRQFERSSRSSQTKVVVISGNYSENEVGKYLSKDGLWRVNHFLKKPLLFEDFYMTVYKLLVSN